MSYSQVARRYSISPTTAWTFMHKVRKAMESSQQQPMIGKVHVDEFVFGGKESLKQGRSYDSKKKKLVVAVELSDDEKVKRVYFKQLNDYSAKSYKQYLMTIFLWMLMSKQISGLVTNQLAKYIILLKS